MARPGDRGDRGVGRPRGLTRPAVCARPAPVVRVATDALRPHFLSLYLYEHAGDFSAFYNADKVAVEDPAIRARRLLLCARTLLILETGLQLLSLRTLKRM